MPCAILTVSDTRTVDSDGSGKLILKLLEAAGHTVVAYEIVQDDPLLVSTTIRRLAAAKKCQTILLTGGTGLASRDTTYEAVAGLMEKQLDGFGELFRMLSYEQIGAPAMLSRAVAGTFQGCMIFAMPGSTAAVSLAMEKLVLPELGHVVWLLGE